MALVFDHSPTPHEISDEFVDFVNGQMVQGSRELYWLIVRRSAQAFGTQRGLLAISMIQIRWTMLDDDTAFTLINDD